MPRAPDTIPETSKDIPVEISTTAHTIIPPIIQKPEKIDRITIQSTLNFFANLSASDKFT